MGRGTTLVATLAVALTLAAGSSARPAAAPLLTPWSLSLPLLQHGDAGHALAHRPLLPAPAKAAATAKPAKPKTARHARPRANARSRPRAPRATISLYERTTNRRVLRRQGCVAAKRGVGGIVILDFGKPAYNGHTYGTILFSDRFAGNREITLALLAYAGGYRYCLRRGSHAEIVLARGTSNYRPSVPSTYKAGRKWARETMQLARWLGRFGFDDHVASAAAIDAEPAWDPRFHKTRDFFRGYRVAGVGRPLYNYGSLDGGVGSYWNARQAFYVTGGMRYARPIPEIYNRTMAKQWAHLAWLAQRRFHRKLRFAGVMTQHVEGCGRCGYLPPKAHTALVRELAARRVHQWVPTATNIRSAS